MLELLEQIENLKTELDHLSIWDELEKIKIKIFSNQELVEKIKKYHETESQSLRLEIYQYDEMKKYKELENEVNFMILEINQILNTMKDRGGCLNENH